MGVIRGVAGRGGSFIVWQKQKGTCAPMSMKGFEHEVDEANVDTSSIVPSCSRWIQTIGTTSA